MGRQEEERRALVFGRGVHFGKGYAKGLAVGCVQLELAHNVCYDFGGLISLSC